MQRTRLLKGKSMPVAAKLVGVSGVWSDLESVCTRGWARNIWADRVT